MNWTTTRVPLWQIDCDNFRRVGRPFELRDATTEEYTSFVHAFAARYSLSFVVEGSRVVFTPIPAPVPSANPASLP